MLVYKNCITEILGSVRFYSSEFGGCVGESVSWCSNQIRIYTPERESISFFQRTLSGCGMGLLSGLACFPAYREENGSFFNPFNLKRNLMSCRSLRYRLGRFSESFRIFSKVACGKVLSSVFMIVRMGIKAVERICTFFSGNISAASCLNSSEEKAARSDRS